MTVRYLQDNNSVDYENGLVDFSPELVSIIVFQLKPKNQCKYYYTLKTFKNIKNDADAICCRKLHSVASQPASPTRYTDIHTFSHTYAVTHDRTWHLGWNPVTKKFLAQVVQQMAGQLSYLATVITNVWLEWLVPWNLTDGATAVDFVIHKTSWRVLRKFISFDNTCYASCGVNGTPFRQQQYHTGNRAT